MNYYPIYNGTRFLDPLFQELLGVKDGLLDENHGALSMRTDVREENDGYVMDIDLPGIRKENINISYENQELTVRVHVNTIQKDEKGQPKGFIRRERFSGSASRSYYVGDIDETAIKAEYVDGVLHICFPKEKPIKNVTHTISIN